MTWEEPEFESVNMSAEIGAYYDDFSAEKPALGNASANPSDPPVAAGHEPGRDGDQ